MTEKKRKALYWTFKALSIIISCAFPILAICEKFPMDGIHRMCYRHGINFRVREYIWHKEGDQ